MSYLRDVSTRETPQTRPLPGQVPNSAGGHAWRAGDWERLQRFLILGSEGGTYYIEERELTIQNADVVLRCAAADGARTVATIVDVSDRGRAPKNDPAIFALAICASAADVATRQLALDALPKVCRIGTHLLHFAAYVEQFRGHGRALNRALGAWYTDRDPGDLAYQLVKYRQRDGWTHGDVLRLAKPRGRDHPLVMQACLSFAVGKPLELPDLRPEDVDPQLAPIEAYGRAQLAATPRDTAALVREYEGRLPREALNPDHLTDPVVWSALLDVGMPMTALMRNLATMTRIGLLTSTAAATRTVLAQLADEAAIRASRVHPLNVLMALKTYASGRSVRGSSEWAPIASIVDALDAMFYTAFGNVEPTGKRRLIALDVSGSMSGSEAGFADIAGFPGLSPRAASSAMAMVSAATGDPYEVVAFTSETPARYSAHGYTTPPQQHPGLSVIPLSARQRLDDVCEATDRIFPGRTNCALPMIYATETGREFDVFEIYTDNETYDGDVHPAQALARYRQKTGINAKLVVVGMVSNGFTIADPDDPGMLDVVGFDTATPAVIADFARGAE